MSDIYSDDGRDIIWQHVPAIEFLDNEEFAEAYPLFFAAMEDARYGTAPQVSDNFSDFLAYMGLDIGDFPWEEFREWMADKSG